MIGGSALIVRAVWTLGLNWRIGQATSDSSCRYVTAGPYRLVGHPIYVGMILSAIGHLLAFLSLPGVMLVTGTVIYVLVQASSETSRWRSQRNKTRSAAASSS